MIAIQFCVDLVSFRLKLYQIICTLALSVHGNNYYFVDLQFLM